MEKFQIAKYGMMQVTAIVYGVLASGAGVKACNTAFGAENLDHIMPNGYHRAVFYRDYGFTLLIVVLAWTALAAYLSSPSSPRYLDPDKLALSGLVFAIILAIMSTFFAFGGFAPFLSITTGMTS